MPLHPQIKDFMDRAAAAGGWTYRGMGVTAGRQIYRQLMTSLPQCQAPLASVEERSIPSSASGSIGLRVYRPAGPGPFPILVFFHGGGFVIGNLDSHDSIARELASGAGVLVVSVDYRLAPEHPFPAGLEDALTATRWVRANAGHLGGRPERIAVGGDSAGGNFAAVVARRIRDEGGDSVACQLLVYPTTRLDGVDMPSMIENGSGYRLEKADMDWFRDLYLREASDGESEDASPLLARDLAGLAPALIQTCEFDPLRDEGEAYAAALRSAGVRVDLRRYDGAIHGTFGLYPVLDPGRRMMDDAIAWLKATL